MPTDPPNSDRSPDPLEILSEALNRSPEQREWYLRHACGADAALLLEVRALLASHDSMGDFLRPVDASEAPFGDWLKRYTVISKIGVGGFGDVYHARQLEPVTREVAIKFLRQCSPQALARFEAESQVLASLEHEYIARLYDAGESPTRQPFLVMEYVAGGVPITEYADTHRLDVSRRLELMIKVCEGVQHAHLGGVIHRDLKPSNILVAGDPKTPRVKIIDFGIAKLHRSDDSSATLTGAGNIVGTPEYLAPEQVRAEGRIDIRADLYALGAIMYELTCGECAIPPGHDHADWIDRLLTKVPARPTDRMARLPVEERRGRLEVRCLDQKALRSRHLRELDWIPMHAIEKEPLRRYQSAAELAADIRRFLRGEALSVGPPTTIYKLGKLARRHRTAIVATAFVLLAGTAATIIAARAHLSEAQKREAVARSEFDQARAAVNTASVLCSNRDYPGARRVLARVPEEQRRWEWSFLNLMCDQSIRTLGQPLVSPSAPFPKSGELLGVAVSEDGDVIVARTGRGTAETWIHGSKLPPPAWVAPEEHVTAIALSAAGDIAARGDLNGAVRLWNPNKAQDGPRSLTNVPGIQVTALAFGPGGAHLAVGDKSGKARICLLSTGSWLELPSHKYAVTDFSFDSAGTLLATSSLDGCVRICRTTDGQAVHTWQLPMSEINCVGFDRAGDCVYAGTSYAMILGWDVKSGKEVFRKQVDTTDVLDLDIRADAAEIYASTRSGRLLVISLTAKDFPLPSAGSLLVGHDHIVTGLCLSRQGSILTTASIDGTIKQWDRNLSASRGFRTNEGRIVSVRLGRQGDVALCGAMYGSAVLSEGLESGLPRLTQVLPPCEQGRSALAMDAKASLAVLACADSLSLIDIDSGPLTRFCRLDANVTATAASADGVLVAAGLQDGSIVVLDRASLSRRFQIPGSSEVRTVAFRRDGSLIVAGDAQGRARVIDCSTGSVVATLDIGDAPLVRATFSPQDKLLACTADNGRVTIVPTGDWSRRDVISSMGVRVTDAAFVSDDRLLFAVGPNIEVWDPFRLGLVLTIPLPRSPDDGTGFIDPMSAIPPPLFIWSMDADPQSGSVAVGTESGFLLLLRSSQGRLAELGRATRATERRELPRAGKDKE